MREASHVDAIRIQLAQGPVTVRQLVEFLQVSQPTISRALKVMGDEVVRVGAGASIQYTLRDASRGFGEIPVYRVTVVGQIEQLGVLIPVRPDGFVMREPDGTMRHTDSLPWWLADMRPQGYIGRAYALNHAAWLGLPSELNEWNDTHALRALLAHGHDGVGNVLLGDIARERFLALNDPEQIAAAQKAARYVSLALEATRGEAPGSSAGGEQPKFLAYAETVSGPRHVIVKFSVAEDNPVSERWRDLLLAEHHAAAALLEAGIAAVRTHVVDHAGQRFLEVERFDRVGNFGRRGLISLAALDAEFVGAGQGWTDIAAALARDKHIDAAAAAQVALLQAIGILIGNTDMHTRNLSFVTEQGRPYQLAPAYDMLPMGFAPRSGGAIPTHIPAATIHANISPVIWRRAAVVARAYVQRLRSETRFTKTFLPCIDAMGAHVDAAALKIARLGD